MAELKDRLRADLTTAMKARDEVRTATVRMVLTAITTEEVAGKQARELDDADVVKVIVREAKKRRRPPKPTTRPAAPNSPVESAPRARCWPNICRVSSTTPS
jgi:hypothetical protein